MMLTYKLGSVSLLAFMLIGSGASQADQAEPADDEVAEVVVTGSRIPRDEGQRATSLTSISAEDLEAQGFRNVFDALNTQTQNTGFTQGADFGNTFTPAANAISLRGLGPNHSLVLVNGRRVTDYPTAYDGQVNFVNLATIPSAAIERIEVLNGSASAIYGSDAIAGVVNIVLRDHVEGIRFNVKAGTTERGGGDNGRLQILGGHEWDRLSTVFALELSKTDPVWSRQRNFMSSNTREGEFPTNIWSRQNLDTEEYIDPTDACNALASAFRGTVVNTTGRNGSQFCGSNRAQPTYWTTQTGNEAQDLYAAAKYALSDQTTLFTDLVLNFNRIENNTRGPNWTSAAASGGFFFNQNSGAYEAWTRRISPEEIGGVNRFNRYWQETAADLTAGIRGKVGESEWNYEAAWSGSVYRSRNLRPRLLANIDTFFLGPQLGTDANGVPIFAPDESRFAEELTPDEFAGLMGRTKSKDVTWLQTVSLTAQGPLFELPAGPVRLAGALEWGSQGFSNQPDPTINEGLYFNTPPVDKVSGSRTRYAAATELRIPMLTPLTATVAGRFDDYKFADRGDNKFTYNLGLEYRPLSTLLLRGNYGTSFRAPDMNYVFQTLTRGYFASTTDYYRCAAAGQPLSDCEFANVSPGNNFIQSGNRDLKFENGKSWGYGVVWSPASAFQASVDYWNLRIDDLVTNIDEDTLLRIEADCRTGARPLDSAQCTDALTRIQRNPADAPLNPNAINLILINPINAAFEQTSGIDASVTARWRLGERHAFTWTTNFTRVLRHRRRQFAGDDEQDYLNALDNVNWRNKVLTSLTWAFDRWTTDVQVTRFSKLPNAAQTDYITPTSIANVSTQFQLNDASAVRVIVNNVFDTIKDDPSFGWPYYPVGNYTPYGRQYWLELDYRFQ
jgi:outer membrane receptor protein involved in Fe transport